MRYPTGNWQRLPTTIITRKDPETGVERFYRVGPDNRPVEIKFSDESKGKSPRRGGASLDSPASSGTGFFISSDGYLLTNYHLVASAAKVMVRMAGSDKPARIVRTDAGNDLALLKIPGNFEAIPLGDAGRVTVGASVMTIGYPNIQIQGASAKFTKGEISSLTGFQDDSRLFQISVPIQPGNSGGPLIDDRGNVVGITNAQLSALRMIAISGAIPQNVNYAVKISYAKLLLDSLPDIATKLPQPRIEKVEIEKIVEQAQKATALVLVWR